MLVLLSVCLSMLALDSSRHCPPTQELAYQRPIQAYLRATWPGSQVQILQSAPLRVLVTVPNDPTPVRVDLNQVLAELPETSRLVIQGQSPWRSEPEMLWAGALIAGLVSLAGLIRLPKPTPRPHQQALRQACIVLSEFPIEYRDNCLKSLKAAQAGWLKKGLEALKSVTEAERQRVKVAFHVEVAHMRRQSGTPKDHSPPDHQLTARILQQNYLSGGPGPQPVTKENPLRRSSRSRRRIFACEVCDEVFIDEEGLRRHEPTHLGKPLILPPQWNRVRAGIGLTLLAAFTYLHPWPARPTQLVLPQARDLSVREQTLVDQAEQLAGGNLVVLRTQTRLVLACSPLDQPALQSLVEQYSPGVLVRPVAPTPWRWLPAAQLVLGLGLLWAGRPRSRPVLPQVAPAQPSLPPAAQPEPVASARPASQPVFELKPPPELSVEVSLNLAELKPKFQARTEAITQHMASELGLALGEIPYEVGVGLNNQEYILRWRGIPMARGTIFVDRYLTIGPLEKLQYLRGLEAQDPVHRMPGKWIFREQIGDAERLGCLTMDPISVLAMHLTELIRAQAGSLFSLEQVKILLEHEQLRVLAQDLAERGVDRLVIWRSLRLLLDEGVSILNLVTILEAFTENLHLSREPIRLVEFARQALADQICREHLSPEGRLNVITLEPVLEQMLQQTGFGGQEDRLVFEPDLGYRLLEALSARVDSVQDLGLEPILLCPPELRSGLRQLIRRNIPQLVVLSWNDIATWVDVNGVAQVCLDPT